MSQKRSDTYTLKDVNPSLLIQVIKILTNFRLIVSNCRL